ncbi:ABC transporter substrate-binding protein [Pseudomonas panipatensis]|uniref:Putative spermidine/putrescine transport system substrate-binding protein n=1 Tax=Pseudomonas panipatensis TaxID=428992 RepID=A0A1G8I855_9PSED|nr:ABC transporter substrate-binding protein [Pseudomonas panipatensis]SDI15044.1 putative spermidine/putrescine transport system substrate-binding protein [Pseudomonas panipatensis]SMP75817.1 putative spermidine/putrescine transport system substrate-binding protein [Pseudomonas panipatensis]
MKHSMIAAALMSLASGAMAADLTVVSFGGTSKDVQTRAFYQPFAKASGNKVVAGEYNGEMGKIKAMVDTHSVNWDVVQVEGPELLRGCEEGLFEPLDAARLGKAEDFVPGTFSDCGAGLLVWSMAMAYDGKRLSSAPTGWADFWDLQKFPGKRSLRKGAKYTLEIALMADGVAKADVYKVLATPEGVDRAFRKLDQIKSSIQWWDSGAQPMQFLASGDVVMSTAYNGRVFAAQNEGAPMKVVWNGSLYAIDAWAIPKGSPNKQAAEDFIAFSLRPEQQKIHTAELGYGSINRNTEKLLDPALAQRLNTSPANLAQAVPVDFAFWVDHGEELELRFNAWAAKAN